MTLDGFVSYEDVSIFDNFSILLKQNDSNSIKFSNLRIMYNGYFNIIPLTPDLGFEVKDDVITFTGEKAQGSMKITSSVENGRTIYTAK